MRANCKVETADDAIYTGIIAKYQRAAEDWNIIRAALDEDWPDRPEFLTRECESLLLALESEMLALRSQMILQ